MLFIKNCNIVDFEQILHRMDHVKENQLELFMRNLEDLVDYYQGISSGSLYFPENIVFFVRLKTMDLCNNLSEVLRNNPVRINSFILSCLEQIISVSDEFKVKLISTFILSNIENCTDADSMAFPAAKTKGNSIVARVQKYVYSDLGKALSTTIIAKEPGISESNLHKQFKRAIGISPGRYLREVKINYACSILEARELSITETAANCGFDSVYSFSRTFKKVTGYSPSQFRKRKKQENF